MRTLWFRLLVVVVLVGTATACGGDAQTVEVTGSETCTTLDTGDDDLHEVYDCVHESSDPRVSGAVTAEVFLEQQPPGTAMWGTIVLTNDGGTWQGDWSGEITPDGNHVIDGVLAGADDYDGLQYVLHVEGVSFPWDVTGTIEPVS